MNEFNKHAYSIFCPVDLPVRGATDSEDVQTPSPFPEDEFGDPVSQLRAYRLNSHPLTALARARSQEEIAALAAHFIPRNLRQLQPTARAVQLANLNSYRIMFPR